MLTMDPAASSGGGGGAFIARSHSMARAVQKLEEITDHAGPVRPAIETFLRFHQMLHVMRMDLGH